MTITKRNLYSGWALFFKLCLLLFSLLSCTSSRKSTELIVASAGKIKSIDPAQVSTFNTLQLLSALGEPLYRLQKNGDLEPRLASKPPLISKDGLTISIPLRKNIFFHDGTRFDAEAMSFSLKRFMRIGTLKYLIDDRISSIETPSKYLLKIKLKRPSTSLRGLLTSVNLTPVSPTSYKDYKNNFLNKKFIGTGPYILTAFNTQQQRLKPFPLYWDKSITNTGINFINLSNSTALFGAMRSGEIDVLIGNSLDEDQRLALHKLSQQGKLREGTGNPLEIGYITLLSNIPPLNRERLRQALALSINRKLITERVSYGLRQPLRSLVPPVLESKSESPWPIYDPVKAEELLKNEGFCTRNKLEIIFTYRSNVPADKLFALTWKEQIEKDLSKCLSLKLNNVESTTVYRQLGKGAFQAVILDWRGAYPDPEAYLSPLLSCAKVNQKTCEKGEANVSGSFWASNEIQKALKLGDKSNGEERLKQMKKVNQLAAKGSAYIPIWIVKPRAWTQPHITKPEFDGSGLLLLERLKKLPNE